MDSSLFKKRFFFDGAMGTQLHAAGLKPGIPPESWNITNSSAVTEIHRKYVNAGSEIITTNTFGAYAHKLGDYCSVSDAVKGGIDCAKASGAKYVALDIGPTGRLMEPMGGMTFDEAYDEFHTIAASGCEADLFLIETMTSLPEARAAVIACREASQKPVFVSLTFEKNGRMLSGADAKTAVIVLQAAGADAIGVNCGLGPVMYRDILADMKSVATVPLFAQPNAGLPEIIDGKTVFPLNAAEFADEMTSLAQYCVGLGGCCGTSPEHIAKTVELCSALPLPEGKQCDKLYIASDRQYLEIGNKPILIGERLNPTGKPKLKKALKSGDYAYLQREAVAQQEKGIDALDVNVGIPDINESEVLKKAVYEVGRVTSLPLQLDSADVGALENSLRSYCGCALINSISGKEKVMDALFPVAKKYGGVLIALTLDDNGIPDTAEGRLAIAEKILKRADYYGFDRKSIIFDPLAMTVSSDTNAAKVTLDSVKLIGEKLGNYTSLGVSNVSFGLPSREVMNSVFFSMALQAGLKCAIMNPNSESMRQAYDCYLTLSGYDDRCESYIAKYIEEQAVQKQSDNKVQLSIKDCVIKGLADEGRRIALEDVKKGADVLSVINGQIIPALDEVGKLFGSGKLFLPQLINSANVAKAVFEAIKGGSSATESKDKKDTIVLATVEGDIHDIGKNIASSILSNYGYNVLDLGKNVPSETIVNAINENNAKLCGLSALMTTTVSSMEKTIAQIKSQTNGCKIMVGGAVLTADYAMKIGADFYCPTAMTDVEIAKSVFGSCNC